MSLIDDILAKFSQETGIHPTAGLRLLDLFLDRAAADLDQIEQTLQNGDVALAARQVHALKGTTANLRITLLAEQAISMERMIRANQLDQAREVLPALRMTTDLIKADRARYQP